MQHIKIGRMQQWELAKMKKSIFGDLATNQNYKILIFKIAQLHNYKTAQLQIALRNCTIAGISKPQTANLRNNRKIPDC